MEQNNDNKKKNEEIKERYRSFRMYARITSIIGNLVGTIILGIFVGFLISKYSGNDVWMGISIIGFSIFAIIDFYIRIIKIK